VNPKRPSAGESLRSLERFDPWICNVFRRPGTDADVVRSAIAIGAGACGCQLESP